MKEQRSLFPLVLERAIRPTALRASTGIRSLSGDRSLKHVINETMVEEMLLSQDAMSYILKMYLSSTNYNRVAIADPKALNIARDRIRQAIKKRRGILGRTGPTIAVNKIVPAHWLASEVFSYVVPATAIPLGTDASDAALLACGIEMVLVILNIGGRHWTLLAYPVRGKADQRHLYHYDSLVGNYDNDEVRAQRVFRNMDKKDAELFEMGLFDEASIAPKPVIISVKDGPKDTKCTQQDKWSCGYAAIAFLDAIARKTERNPGLFQRKPKLYPLETGDLPRLAKLKYTTLGILNSAQEWGEKKGLETIWKWVQPPKSVDLRGYPDPSLPFEALRKKRQEKGDKKVVISLNLEDNGFWN